jgi:hypothetical protein
LKDLDEQIDKFIGIAADEIPKYAVKVKQYKHLTKEVEDLIELAKLNLRKTTIVNM